MEVTLSHYLVLSAILFAIGVYGILTRRNAIALLMCVELMLNAVNINLVAMNRFLQPDWRIVTGQIFAASSSFWQQPKQPSGSLWSSPSTETLTASMLTR